MTNKDSYSLQVNEPGSCCTGESISVRGLKKGHPFSGMALVCAMLVLCFFLGSVFAGDPAEDDAFRGCIAAQPV